MEPHPYPPDVSFDGGDLDCGNGLLLLIRRHIDPLRPGGLLEIRSSETSVEEDLPAWCRLTGNQLVSFRKEGRQRSYLVSRGAFQPPEPAQAVRLEIRPIHVPETLPAAAPAPAVPPLAVMGIGSWPRPRWMLQALHDHLSGRLGEAEFQATADDAVRLAVQAQLEAGVDLVCDGEQRRDSYASFVGGRLDNCQLIPLTDLAALVDEPEKFAAELRALDVPAAEVRHPVVYGPLGRSRPLAGHESDFLARLTDRPRKVALPGPYLLTRTMWLDCLTDRYYASREELSRDVVRVLREELHDLLARGVSLVQLDEPVLTEVVFSGAKNRRSFMCGALSERGDSDHELEFAHQLWEGVTAGLPRERLALHVCRGNWTRDEESLLRGDYTPLKPLLERAPVGTLLLEFSTPRAGELKVMAGLPERLRVGVGLVNPKLDRLESEAELERRAREALDLFGPERLLLTPDCGFATFADNPVSSAELARQKLSALARTAARLRQA